MKLHPELARLDAQYRNLHQDVVDGALSVDDAIAALDNLTAFDGTGAQWGIDDRGKFYRHTPGSGEREFCDPAKFVASQLPARPGADQQPPWAAATPSQPGATPTRAPAQPLAVQPAPPPVTAPQHLGDEKPGIISMLRDKAPSGQIRLLIAVAAAAAVLAYLAVFVRGDSPTEPVTPSTTTTTTDITTPSFEGDTSAVTVERTQETIRGITSGERDVAAALVAEPGSAAVRALRTAQLAGLNSDDLTVTAGPAEADGDNAVQRWELVERTGGTVWATATVRWVTDDDGVWTLAKWPEFTPVG